MTDLDKNGTKDEKSLMRRRRLFRKDSNEVSSGFRFRKKRNRRGCDDKLMKGEGLGRGQGRRRGFGRNQTYGN